MAEELETKIKLTADKRGADEVVDSLDKIGKKSNQVSQQTRAGFNQIAQSARRLTSALNMLKTGFGALAVFQMVSNIVTAFENWGKAAKDAKTETENLAAAAREATAKKIVEDAAESYNHLKESIKTANDELQRMNELRAAALTAERSVEDAKLKAEEEAAIEAAGGDADQEALIRSQYAKKRAESTTARQLEDFDNARQEEEDRANAKYREADEKLARAKELDKDIQRLSLLAGEADTRANADNEKDRGIGRQMWRNFGKLFSFELPDGDMRSEEGDQIRQKAAEERDNYRKQIADIRKQQEELREGAIADRREGEQISSLSGAKAGERAAIVLNGETSQLVAGRAVKKVERRIAATQAQHASDITAQELLTREKLDLEERIAAEQEKKRNAAQSVFDAQSNFNLAKMNGKGQQEAYTNLTKAQQAAWAVDHSADEMITTLTDSLNKVNGKLTAVQRNFEKQAKQHQFEVGEMPGGE